MTMLVWLGISLVKTKTGQNGPFCLPLSTSIKMKRKSCELSNVQSLRKAMSSFHQKNNLIISSIFCSATGVG